MDKMDLAEDLEIQRKVDGVTLVRRLKDEANAILQTTMAAPADVESILMPLDLRRSPNSFTWREIDFHVTECSFHSGSCRFESKASRWVVRRFDRGGTWYARLKLGCHRFDGKGTSKIRALEAALAAATTVQSELQRTLPLPAPAVPR